MVAMTSELNLTRADIGQSGPVVQLRGIKKSFGIVEVLHGVDLSVHAGEHVVIFGPSGSGKSTVLRTINLLEQPSAGSVRIDGVEYGPGELASGEKQSVEVAGRRYVSRLAVTLPLRRPRRTILVTADMLPAADFRRLRVWALWGKLPGVAAAQLPA